MKIQKFAIVCIAMLALYNTNSSYCDESHNIYQDYINYNPFDLTDSEINTINNFLSSINYKGMLFGDKLSNLISNTITGKNLHENTGIIFGKGDELGIYSDYMEYFEILSIQYEYIKQNINNDCLNQIDKEMNIIEILYKKTFNPIEFQINTDSNFVNNLPENYKSIISKIESKNLKEISENYEIKYKNHLQNLLQLTDNLAGIDNKYLTDYKNIIKYQINKELYKKRSDIDQIKNAVDDCNII